MLTDGRKLLHDKHLGLLSFLITSTRGLFNELEIYGPLRLVGLLKNYWRSWRRKVLVIGN